MKSPIRLLAAGLAIAALAACGSTATEATTTSAAPTETDTLTVVTHDSFVLPQELLDQFAEETGYTVTYVAPGDALDREALDRGNSYYFPSSVEPMFPTALSNGLQAYPGNLFFASHDHQFIDEIANRIIEVKGDGTVVNYQGSYEDYLAKSTPKEWLPGQMNYWQNTPKFFVSLMKAFYGNAATAENNWAFDWLPKWDKSYDVLQVFELMHQGKINGYMCQGFNPVASFPNKNKVIESLSKLKFLVIMDPLVTDTSTFWKNHGEQNDVKTEDIQTEVFRLPTTCFAEEEGAIVNSGRWLQWHWKGAEPPGEAKSDQEIIGELFTAIRELYRKDGGNCLPLALPSASLKHWACWQTGFQTTTPFTTDCTGPASTKVTRWLVKSISPLSVRPARCC